jgi:hypothetical protein
MDSPIRHLRYPPKRPVPCLEVQIRRPVIAQIIRWATGRTRRQFRDIRGGHRCVEGVAAYYLVDVRRWDHPWVYEGVETLDGYLGTAEAEVIETGIGGRLGGG